MERSKCVVCGKVRKRKFLIPFPNFEDQNVWVCNRAVSYNSNYIIINQFHFSVHPCQITYLERMHKSLEIMKNNYLAAKKCLYVYDKILQDKNVGPELTFLLQ